MRVFFYIFSSCFINFLSISGLSQYLPIKPTRTISFTTDEGSGMDVSVSPDGRLLAFDLLGDLYLVPSTGGRAKQLTRGLSLNLHPVWSPDGSKIAYISDYSGSFHLNVRDTSGKFHTILGKAEEQLNLADDPLWTSDGNFISVGDSVYGLAGGKISLNIPIKFDKILGFSDNEENIYYTYARRIYCFNNIQKTQKEYVSKKLSSFESGILSPDLHWWAYVKDSSFSKCLIIRNLLDSSERTLVPSLCVQYPGYGPYAQARFSFSSDSKNIFIGYGGKLHRINVNAGENHIIPFVANIKSDLGALNYHTFPVLHDSLKVRYTRSCNASPDGKHLVFSALEKLYIMDLPNGKPHELVDQSMGQFYPAFSPDGKWIAYVSWVDTIGGQLWLVPSSGGQPKQLTHEPGNYQRPAWSPDGSLIAVIDGTPKLEEENTIGIGRIELVSVNGDSSLIVVDTVPLWNQLVFSSDGKKIFYEPQGIREDSRVDTLGPQLISVGLDRKKPKIEALGRTRSLHSYLQEVTISPDYRYIVYSMSEDLYLVPLSNLTHPAVIYDPSQKISLIRFASGVDPCWGKQGKVLGWTYGNHFYSIDPDKIVAAAQNMEASGLAEKDLTTIFVKPDQTVDINVKVPRLYSHGVIALRNVRILTMQDSKVIEHGTIVIKNDRFVAIGPDNSVQIPAGAKLLDLPGMTVIPGFIDMHLHMNTPENIHPQQSWLFLSNLAYGVTTARNPATSVDSYGYVEYLQSGEKLGPRLYTSGRIVSQHLESISRVNSLSDARAIVKKRAELGGVFVKQYILPTRLQRQWLLLASEDAGLNMTNEGYFEPILQLGIMKDGNGAIEHNPEWGELYKDRTTFIAKSGIYLTPTLQVRYGDELYRQYSNYLYWHHATPKMERFIENYMLQLILNARHRDTARGYSYPAIMDATIRKKGGRVLLGSHGNNDGVAVHNELWALQMGGLTNMEALQAATIMGAEGLGVQKDLGSIEVGKIADLIVLNKNPLDDIHNSREIRYVMKDGILYDGETLDTIWPYVKKCPEWRLKSDTTTVAH